MNRDQEAPEFRIIRNALTTARKAYACSDPGCARPIPVGESCRVLVTVEDGKFCTARYHPLCAP